MKALNKIVFYLTKAIRIIGTLILCGIILSVTAGIVSRYVFNKPFSWTEELTTFLMVYLCYFSAYITTVDKKHIVADFLIAKAPEKFQKIVSIFSKILMIVFFVVVCISVIKVLPTLVWKSGVLEIHRRFYYYPVFAMCACSAFAVCVDILNDIFPGYNLIDEEIAKEEALAKEQERLEAEEMQKNMDKFMEEAEKELGSAEKEGKND